jgi:hypothetical protein
MAEIGVDGGACTGQRPFGLFLRYAAKTRFCLSEDTYRQVKLRLDLLVTDLGATHLKNITEPMRVYSLQVGSAVQTEPAPAAQVSAPEAPVRRVLSDSNSSFERSVKMSSLMPSVKYSYRTYW